MPRGRKPIPAAVRRLTGNPSKRPIVEGIVLPPGEPTPPWPMTKEAKREWTRLCAALAPANLLAHIDADALALWAETLVRYQEASKDLARHGSLITGPNGLPVVNPAQKIIKECLVAMQRFQAEFGATPSARMKVKGNQAPAAVDPFDAFLANKPPLNA